MSGGSLRLCTVAVNDGRGRNPLKPEADARDEPCVVRVMARRASQIGRAAEAALAHQAEVGGDFAPNLVTQAEPELAVGEPRADGACGVGLAVPVELEQRLQDQPIRDQQLVGRFEA